MTVYLRPIRSFFGSFLDCLSARRRFWWCDDLLQCHDELNYQKFWGSAVLSCFSPNRLLLVITLMFSDWTSENYCDVATLLSSCTEVVSAEVPNQIRVNFHHRFCSNLIHLNRSDFIEGFGQVHCRFINGWNIYRLHARGEHIKPLFSYFTNKFSSLSHWNSGRCGLAKLQWIRSSWNKICWFSKSKWPSSNQRSTTELGLKGLTVMIVSLSFQMEVRVSGWAADPKSLISLLQNLIKEPRSLEYSKVTSTVEEAVGNLKVELSRAKK